MDLKLKYFTTAFIGMFTNTHLLFLGQHRQLSIWNFHAFVMQGCKFKSLGIKSDFSMCSPNFFPVLLFLCSFYFFFLFCFWNQCLTDWLDSREFFPVLFSWGLAILNVICYSEPIQKHFGRWIQSFIATWSPSFGRFKHWLLAPCQWLFFACMPFIPNFIFLC